MSHTALEAREVSVQRGGRHILHVNHLSLASAAWTSVVGPNGAGKSTLLKMLAGLWPASAQDRGQVALFGQDLKQWSARQRAQQLAWLGQHQTTDDLRVADVVMLGRLPHQPWFAGPSEVDHAKVQEALQATQAWAWRDRPLGQLSGGERQRVLLARLLAVDARVLLMDEPLANLDPPHQADWLVLVRDLVSAGKTVVSVLHEISMALQSDELVILKEGRVIQKGAAQDPQIHAALCQAFDHRISVHTVGGQWVALPQ